MRMTRYTAVAAVAIFLSVGCSDTEVSTVADDGAMEVPAASESLSPAKEPSIEGFVPGESVHVANKLDLSQDGFVAWDDLYPPPGERPANLVPVVDEAGKQIAVWGADIGWISLEEANAPGFSYEKAHAAEVARVSNLGPNPQR